MFSRFRFQNRTPTREKRSGLLSGLETNKTSSPKSSNSETEELKGIYEDMDFPGLKSEDVKVGRFERVRIFYIFIYPFHGNQVILCKKTIENTYLCMPPGVRVGLCNPSYWDGGV